jgi:hypothetical protein
MPNVSVQAGKFAQFSCRFLCNPLASSVIWYKNEREEIIENDQNIVISILGTAESETILRITKPDLKDNGANFSVRIKNDLGEVTSSKGFLNITTPPMFLAEPTDRCCLKEREARFECIVKGNPRPNVSWFFEESEITNKENSRLEIDKLKDKYSLTIPRVLLSSVGSYRVRAVNEYGSIEKTIKLTISELPKIISELENLQINEKETASFSLKVSGLDRPPFKWYKDEKAINPSENFEIIEQNDIITLNIKSCETKNAGNYYLKFKNDFGEVESNKAQLVINSIKIKFLK